MHSRREGNDINCTHFSKRENDIESRTTLCYRAKLECMSISHAVIKFALKREKQKLMSVMPHAESVTEYFFFINDEDNRESKHDFISACCT